ncbi:MAG: hypothetical protein PVG07_10530 [Acidobacteriota bacterium]|jgi:hypothetical protein
MKITRSLSLLVLACLALVLATGCSIEHEIVAEGESEATITIEKGFSICLKGGEEGISIPEGIPRIGGLEIGPGAEITVDIPPGTEIVLEDEIHIGGEGSSGSSSDQVDSNGLQQAVTARPITPKPVPTTVYQGTVFAGSTYTWYIPDMFGDEGAVVPVTGWITAEAYENALVTDADGNYTLRDGGLIQFSYNVSGPPAVWQAPFDTPYGRITGDGTIETTSGMIFEFSGATSAVAGNGTNGYVDPDGNTWEYGWNGTFPVKLTTGAGEGSGVSTMGGGLDVYP